MWSAWLSPKAFKPGPMWALIQYRKSTRDFSKNYLKDAIQTIYSARHRVTSVASMRAGARVQVVFFFKQHTLRADDGEEGIGTGILFKRISAVVSQLQVSSMDSRLTGERTSYRHSSAKPASDKTKRGWWWIWSQIWTDDTWGFKAE